MIRIPVSLFSSVQHFVVGGLGPFQRLALKINTNGALLLPHRSFVQTTSNRENALVSPEGSFCRVRTTGDQTPRKEIDKVECSGVCEKCVRKVDLQGKMKLSIGHFKDECAEQAERDAQYGDYHKC